LEAKLAEALAALEAKDAAIAEASSKLGTKETELQALTEEISPLREFKAQADLQAQRAEKLSAVKAKFESASIQKPEDYFEENAEKLLALDDAALDFMVQEMVAFKSSEASQSNNDEDRPTIPNIPGEGESIKDPKSLGIALREMRNKK